MELTKLSCSCRIANVMFPRGNRHGWEGGVSPLFDMEGGKKES